MANRVILKNENALQHYGVMGMKWGVRKADRKTSLLSRKVTKTVKKYDRGKDPDVKKISKSVRKERHKVEMAIRKAERFIARSNKADSKQIVNRYNKNPAKKTMVENYIKSMNLNVTTLSELHLQLIDIRV